MTPIFRILAVILAVISVVIPAVMLVVIPLIPPIWTSRTTFPIPYCAKPSPSVRARTGRCAAERLGYAGRRVGRRLSEGEKQRIGLARMFLRDADLVLFDEPTSRLDAYNESVILGSINDLAERGSAVVLVSHRDSTMRIADRILRM